MPVNWPAHAKGFLSDDLSKKVMPNSGDFEEWCGTPCQVRSMSGALDLVRGQALIDIGKQPALLVHLVGVGKPDGQVADHIHDKLHNNAQLFKPASRTRVGRRRHIVPVSGMSCEAQRESGTSCPSPPRQAGAGMPASHHAFGRRPFHMTVRAIAS